MKGSSLRGRIWLGSLASACLQAFCRHWGRVGRGRVVPKTFRLVGGSSSELWADLRTHSAIYSSSYPTQRSGPWKIISFEPRHTDPVNKRRSERQSRERQREEFPRGHMSVVWRQGLWVTRPSLSPSLSPCFTDSSEAWRYSCNNAEHAFRLKSWGKTCWVYGEAPNPLTITEFSYSTSQLFSVMQPHLDFFWSQARDSSVGIKELAFLILERIVFLLLFLFISVHFQQV